MHKRQSTNLLADPCALQKRLICSIPNSSVGYLLCILASILLSSSSNSSICWFSSSSFSSLQAFRYFAFSHISFVFLYVSLIVLQLFLQPVGVPFFVRHLVMHSGPFCMYFVCAMALRLNRTFFMLKPLKLVFSAPNEPFFFEIISLSLTSFQAARSTFPFCFSSLVYILVLPCSSYPLLLHFLPLPLLLPS